MTAWKELLGDLKPTETIEAIIFGNWGWDGYCEPEPSPVPTDMRGVVLTPEQAEPLMQSWKFGGGYGAPDCYAVRIFTNERTGWVTQYDGATWLDWAPRNPVAHMPDMPGG